MLIARCFIVLIVAMTYGLSLIPMPRVFRLGIWTFSGFASLVPLAFASLYWRGVTKAGAYASVFAVIGSWWLLFQAADFGNNPRYTFLGMQPVATMFVSATVALVSVSFMTKPPGEETLQKFFPRRETQKGN